MHEKKLRVTSVQSDGKDMQQIKPTGFLKYFGQTQAGISSLLS